MVKTIDTVKMQQGREPIAAELNTMLNVIHKYYNLTNHEADIIIEGFYDALGRVIDNRRHKIMSSLTRNSRRYNNED